jgi:hypothetical protein
MLDNEMRPSNERARVAPGSRPASIKTLASPPVGFLIVQRLHRMTVSLQSPESELTLADYPRHHDTGVAQRTITFQPSAVLMKKFLVLYRSPVTARAQMANATPEQAKAGMDAWMTWAGKNGDTIVDLGAPLGDGVVVAGSALGAADKTIGGFSIVQGDSAESIVKKFADHPHFMMPGGASIEVYEYLEMPGM